MMSKLRLCVFLMVNAVAGVLSVSGTGIASKYVCPGDSVEAFQKIEFDHCNAFVSLNINGERNTQIATWSLQNCTLNVSLLPQYKDRVFLDQNGTITIRNLHHFDQAKYVVISRKDTLTSIKEVQIYVMIAPSKDCKPIILRLGNTLLASLEADKCGTPAATPYWKGYGNISDTNEPLLKLKPGNEAGTYYACIKGPALECAKNLTSRDYCDTFIIEGNNSSTMSSEPCNTTVLLMFSIVLGILLTVAIIAIVILIRKLRRTRHLKGEHTMGLLDVRQPVERHFDNVNGVPTVPLLETPQLWENHFGILKWDDIRQLLNDDQKQGLQTYCDNLRPSSDDQQQGLEARSVETAPHFPTHRATNSRSIQTPDPDHQMEEAETENQSSLDPEQIQELQELRDIELCKICFASTKSVFHITTSANCSIVEQKLRRK